jgi:hypothetical protein
MDVKSLGIPSEDEYIRKYCKRTGLATPDTLKADWNFYLAYNLFRLAAILQGIAKRVEAGTASSAQAVSSAAGARVALSTKHTLALTNRGGASATELLQLAAEVRDGVLTTYGVELVNEPVLVGCELPVRE